MTVKIVFNQAAQFSQGPSGVGVEAVVAGQEFELEVGEAAAFVDGGFADYAPAEDEPKPAPAKKGRGGVIAAPVDEDAEDDEDAVAAS